MFELMLASRHSWVSPGRMGILGLSCPFTVRFVGAPIVRPSVRIEFPATWKSFSAMTCSVMPFNASGRCCSSPSTMMIPDSPPATCPAELGSAWEWYQYVPGVRSGGNRYR